MAFHTQILGIATSQNWVALGVNMILSTLLGGIVIIALLSILGRAWGEKIKPANAFAMVLIINAVTYFGILTLFSSFPVAGIILPLVIWILLTKAFFSGLALWHALVVGVVGFFLSIFLIPTLVAAASGYLPGLGL